MGKRPDLAVTAYHLTYRDNTSNKFYEIQIVENGLCILRWGRVGSVGQSSITMYPTLDQAEDHGKKQLYAKKSKGYAETWSYKYMGTADEVDEARRENLGPLREALNRAKEAGTLVGARDTVLSHYADFNTQVQAMLHEAGDPAADYIEVMGKLEGLEQVWDDINAKHGELQASLSLLKQTLAQRLMATV